MTIKKYLIDYESEKSLAYKMRQKRSYRLKQLIEECFKKYGKVDIIDIGGTKQYWNIIPKKFLIENRVKITLVNLYVDKQQADDEIFTCRDGDGCNLANFSDKSFEIAHSNSVIEHVGDDEHRRRFAAETKRVAKNYYLQTPNFWFPVDPHLVAPFFQYLPDSVKVWIFMNFNFGFFHKSPTMAHAKERVKHFRLLSKKSLRKLFPDDKIYNEYFACFVKSLILIGKESL